MTGLPNQAGLDRELQRHDDTHPLGILVADFDGMREANSAFDNNYELGGDVLIRAVAAELGRFTDSDEFAARLHTRGDEFCLLLPGCRLHGYRSAGAGAGGGPRRTPGSCNPPSRVQGCIGWARLPAA